MFTVRDMNLLKTRVALTSLLIAVAIGTPVSAQTVKSDGTILKQVIIFGRHGVRAPVMPPANYAAFSPRPYPSFGVPPGYLTAHGQQAATLLGTYFRQYLLAEGLLSGDNETDLGHSYFRANSIQRSNLTATMFGGGLVPGATIPVHSFPLGQADPVFDPIAAGVAAVDPQQAANEVQEIFNSGTALGSAYSAEFSLIRSVLFNTSAGAAIPTGIIDPTAQSIPFTPVTSGIATGNVVNLGGIGLTELMADPFIMEYANGMPLADVAWGQLSMDALSQQSRIVVLEESINYTTPYLDQVQSSNAASHVLHSIQQSVLGETVPGAFTSDPATRVLVVISSDTYVKGLAGLLRAHWQLPGYQPDFCAPGGALVFELRQSRSTGEYLVRVYYTAQSLDQLRNLTPLSLSAPPETTQIMIPGGSRPGSGMDIRFRTFQNLLENAIGGQYVENPATEVRPGVLSGVPLQ